MPQYANQPAAQQRRNRRNKGAERRLKLLALALLALFVWAGVTLWDQLGKIHEKSAQLTQLQAKLAETSKINADSKKAVERLNDKEIKDEKARSDLGYTKDGETLFEVPKAKP